MSGRGPAWQHGGCLNCACDSGVDAVALAAADNSLPVGGGGGGAQLQARSRLTALRQHLSGGGATRTRDQLASRRGAARSPASARIPPAPPLDKQQLLKKIGDDTAGMLCMAVAYMGDSLGLFRALADAGERGLGSEALAGQLKLHPRYVLEWCRAAVANQLVECAASGGAPVCYFLSAAQCAVLGEEGTDDAQGGSVQTFVSALLHAPDVVQKGFVQGGGPCHTTPASQHTHARGAKTRRAYGAGKSPRRPLHQTCCV